VTARLRIAAGALGLGLLAGCTGAPAPPPAPAPTGSSPSATPRPGTAAPTATAPVEPAEPTTTNTLPPPPEPSAPAPSTAGDLDAEELPVPAGWRTVALEGGTEEGFRGNGTWVHARDPRYAAQDAITIGCADVTRDDYPDPVAALEGNYVGPDEAPGVALLLQFADPDAAARYWARYTDQVRACQTVDDPVRTEVVVDGAAAPDQGDLVDRRRYADSAWTEVARRSGARVTLVILGDEDHAITTTEARRLLDQLG
jgi:hypothetical protein